MSEPEIHELPFPAFLVFGTGACLMMVELVVARILAEHLGGSLYSWTSVVGVALTGIALGGVLGGRMADRMNPRHLLWFLFLTSSLLCPTVLLGELLVGAKGVLSDLQRPVRVLIGAPILLLPAAISLSCIPPVVARAVLEGKRDWGHRVGRLYAWGSLGSIAGTLLAGFFFISFIGTRSLLCLLGALLAGACLLLGAHRQYNVILGLWCAVLLALTAILYQGIAWENDYFTRESNYYRIHISFDQEENIKTLYLDNLAHSILHPGQPENLAYEYEQIFALLTDRATNETHASTLTLGAGGYAFPRYLVEHYPQWQVHVVEIDPLLTRVAHEQLELPYDTPIVTFHSDARRFLAEMNPKRRYNLIYGDAFNSFSIPWHLTTREFHEILISHLKEGGTYLANVIDIYRSSRFLGAYVNTLRSTFPHVTVFATQPVRDQTGRDTFVVAASLAPIQLAGIREEAIDRDVDLYILTEEQVQESIRRAGRVLFTDSFAPVDQSMASMLWTDRGKD